MNENKDFSCLCTFKFLIVNDRIKLFQLVTKWKSDQLYNLGTRGHDAWLSCGVWPLLGVSLHFLSGQQRGKKPHSLCDGVLEDSS